MRQAGNASGSISFLMRTEDENKIKAFKDQLRCDLGDLLLQTEMLIRDLRFNINEIKQLSYERYDECKEEFKQKGKSQYFI